jgi:16S rRNA G1207 methylase RsmC
VMLAEHNAAACGLKSFRTVGSDALADLPQASFDVILANPPYYAQQAIAHFFIARSQMLLKRGGRLFLVTRQAGGLLPMIEDTFGDPEIIERRGYTIFRCRAR